MNTFDYIALIYNPKSTGNAKSLAHKLAAQIESHHKEIGIHATLTPTEYAGHAHEIAKQLCQNYTHPLIVSISGDGGYNEVINGTMSAKNSHSAVVATVGAGNANDHKRMTRGNTPLIELIKQHKPKPLDLLKCEAQTADFALTRYAHSYVGLGISPKVGYELNKGAKNRLREALVLLKTFWHFAPFEIIVDEQKTCLDSLVFANISQMAKILKLEPETDVQNNHFRVVLFYHVHKIRLLLNVLKAVFLSTKSDLYSSRYTFTTLTSELVQFDGEIEKVPAHTTITITSSHAAVQSLYAPSNA